MWVMVAGLAVATPARAQTRDIRPPPTNFTYLQYGVGLTTETVLSAADVCPANSTTPCILGSGLGPAIRVGYRSRGPWYVGGAYEFSRQESSNLLRLAILQQFRAEFRYYADEGDRLTPYAAGGLGAALYGSEWATDTGGVTSYLGAGLEFQVSRTTVVGVGLAYRALLLRGWTDRSGQRRADHYLGFGLAHLLAIELIVEVRDPLPRW